MLLPSATGPVFLLPHLLLLLLEGPEGGHLCRQAHPRHLMSHTARRCRQRCCGTAVCIPQALLRLLQEVAAAALPCGGGVTLPPVQEQLLGVPGHKYMDPAAAAVDMRLWVRQRVTPWALR